MLYGDKNYYLLTKSEFLDELTTNKDKAKLYHFIVYKYQDGRAFFVDNSNDIVKLPDNYKVKYYCEKILYSNEKDNDYFEYGEAFHILNLGYFRIGGFAKEDAVPSKTIEKLYVKYDSEYPDMTFDVGDTGFLMLGDI